MFLRGVKNWNFNFILRGRMIGTIKIVVRTSTDFWTVFLPY